MTGCQAAAPVRRATLGSGAAAGAALMQYARGRPDPRAASLAPAHRIDVRGDPELLTTHRQLALFYVMAGAVLMSIAAPGLTGTAATGTPGEASPMALRWVALFLLCRLSPGALAGYPKIPPGPPACRRVWRAASACAPSPTFPYLPQPSPAIPSHHQPSPAIPSRPSDRLLPHTSARCCGA